MKKTVTLMNTNMATLVLIMAVLLVIGYLLRSREFFSELRRVPAIDALDEGVNLCAERGRPFFASCGTASMSGNYLASMIGQLHALCYVAERCAKLNVRLITDSQDPQVQSQVVDYVRQGYINAGAPERFRLDDQFYAASAASQLDIINCVEMYKPATVWNGSSLSPAVLDAGVRVGAFNIAFGTWPDQASDMVTLADHLIFQEEMTAAGAYLSKDLPQTAAIIGEDFGKLMMIGIFIVFLVAAMAGVHLKM